MNSPAGSGDFFDVCVIGGGINGAGIARDAAGRGLRVLLVEQGDLGQATSSASTKLIHGGLRYLEYYEFGLVRHSLIEREVLMNLAPHIIHPLTFHLPLIASARPAWMIRAGLFLYDCLAGRNSLPSSRSIRMGTDGPLRPDIRKGFSYADCWVDDARLVVLNAMSARDKGANVRTRTECTEIRPLGRDWRVTLKDRHGTSQVKSRLVVNATGPWVRSFLDRQNMGDAGTPNIRLVQGSHIIVPRLYEETQAYILQQPDGRIVFTIPYEGRYTLIGTTETSYRGDPLQAAITREEKLYLISAVNSVFRKSIAEADIIGTYSGVRPLFDDHHEDAKAVTRDYRLHETEHQGAWLLSVFGGKLTTYRKLSEQVTDRLVQKLDIDAPAWTHQETLPGGNLPEGNFSAFLSRKKQEWPAIEHDLLERYARQYGTRMDEILLADPGRDYGAGVCEAELRYLISQEYACTAADILWRRTKLGLHLPQDVIGKIEKAVPDLVQEMGL